MAIALTHLESASLGVLLAVAFAVHDLPNSSPPWSRPQRREHAASSLGPRWP
jgi:hypothetical protein